MVTLLLGVRALGGLGLIILLSAKFAHMVGLRVFPHYLKAIISFITFQGFPSIFWHSSGTCFCFISGFYLLLKKHKLLCNMDLPRCYVRRALEQNSALNVHFTS